MTLIIKAGKHAELYHIFHDQLDHIKNKRAAIIKLSNIPSGINLGKACEILSEILTLFSPLVHLERLVLADNSLKSLPAEFELLGGACMRYLDLHNNNFSTVPEIIGTCCPHLEGLDISLNQLKSLSRSVFSNLLDLKVLLLKSNEFHYLPPLLGEMINLDAIAVAENPLLMPTLEMVRAMPGGTNDLKAYLIANSSVLELHIQLQTQHNQKAPTTPSVGRTRSFSESGSKSLKASRRMGLIINSNKTTPEDNSRSQAGQLNFQDSFTPSKSERKLLSEKSDISSLLEHKESAINLDITALPSTYTTSTSSRSRSSSPSGASLEVPLIRPGSRNRSRWNRDINSMLESNDLTDSELKSGAYFRRLSTLQERPADEMYRTSQDELSGLSQNEASFKHSQTLLSALDNSPLKNTSRKPSLSVQSLGELILHQGITTMYLPETSSAHYLTLTLKVARKLQFSFREVHSSLKRLTGFCSDRKVVMRVVPVLHATKSNIDSLGECIEVAEDSGDNQEPLLNAIHHCIKSFEPILEIIIDNIASFVAKVEVCFVRMVYLILYGSVNEIQNAYRILNPPGVPMKVPPAIPRNQSGLVLATLDSKFKHVQSAVTSEEFVATGHDATSTIPEPEPVSLDEIDEKFYLCIDLATLNAQTVFSELTKAIGKSAIASANTNGSQSINLAVSTKFKELTNVCIASMDITKRLKLKLSNIRANPTPLARRLFWDDVNLFLKAILLTFSSVKAIMKDAPILNEVRQSMATLTKTTKDLTILLEASSYKSMSDSLVSAAHLQASLALAVLPPSAPPSISSLHSTSAVNLSQLQGTTLVRTPLVATVGAAAAQAILPSSDSIQLNSSTINAPTTFSIPPLVSSDVLNTGMHTAPVQSMEQYYAKNVNPFDRI